MFRGLKFSEDLAKIRTNPFAIFCPPCVNIPNMDISMITTHGDFFIAQPGYIFYRRSI